MMIILASAMVSLVFISMGLVILGIAMKLNELYKKYKEEKESK